MKAFIEDNGFVKFQYKIESESSHTITFEVHEVTGWGENESTGKYDVPCDTELYLKAYMKWDGCFHFWLGDSDGYIHLCGESEIAKHIEVMNKCLEFAKTKIKAYDSEVAK